jgi:hypothetical protein
MGRHLRRAVWRCSAVILVVAVVVPAASGLAGVTQTSAVSAKLVGKWTRKSHECGREAHRRVRSPRRNRLHAHRQEERCGPP